MKGNFLGLVGFRVFPEVMSPNKKGTCYSFSYGGFDGISSLLLICFHGRRRVILMGWLVYVCVCWGKWRWGNGREEGRVWLCI